MAGGEVHVKGGAIQGSSTFAVKTSTGFPHNSSLGLPTSGGFSYRPGARFGPSHVRESSRLLRPYNPAQNIAPFELCQVTDAGDLVANPFDIEQAIEQIEAGAEALQASGARLVTIGGDHTIALPLLRVAARRHGPLAVVHFDAHLDTWDTYFGAPFTHGTPFRRASEEGLIDQTASLHVGIRGPLYDAEDLTDDERLGFAVITSDDYQREGLAPVIERVRRRMAGKPMCRLTSTFWIPPTHLARAPQKQADSPAARSSVPYGRSAVSKSSAPTSSRSHPPTITRRSPV